MNIKPVLATYNNLSMPYFFSLLLFLCLLGCDDAPAPSEQVPVTTTVDNSPRPAVPQPTPAEVPEPMPQVQNAPLPNTPTAAPNTGAKPGNNGTMTMENLDNVQVIMNPNLFLSPEQLLEKVQRAIIPVYKNWVLFKYGTFIILDDISQVTDVAQEAKRLLATYRPKSVLEKPTWDYSISHLEQVEGWSVYGNGYGIYTYVNPDEMVDAPTPPTIIVFARNKRTLDENNPQVLYSSSVDGIRAY